MAKQVGVCLLPAHPPQPRIPADIMLTLPQVGSGKSSLLSCVLGEAVCTEGVVTSKGDVAYVSQEPWVHSGTVRSNVLFGDDYLPER